MITAEKIINIDPVAGLNPVADTSIVHEGKLVIHVSVDDANYHLFEDMLKSLQVEVKENIKSE